MVTYLAHRNRGLSSCINLWMAQQKKVVSRNTIRFNCCPSPTRPPTLGGLNMNGPSERAGESEESIGLYGRKGK